MEDKIKKLEELLRKVIDAKSPESYTNIFLYTIDNFSNSPEEMKIAVSYIKVATKLGNMAGIMGNPVWFKWYMIFKDYLFKDNYTESELDKDSKEIIERMGLTVTIRNIGE